MVPFLVPAAVTAGEWLAGGALLLLGYLGKKAIEEKDFVGASFQYGNARAELYAYDNESKNKKSSKRGFFS